MPKVSVIIPIYNVASYLRECLDSVIRQTLTDLEIICVNDGSTDHSLEIIQECAAQDRRIRVIDKPNSGYGHTVNSGIAAATGEYIGIVESDDFAEASMFERLYEAAVRNEAEVVMSNFVQFTTQPAFSSQFVENFKGCPYDRIFSPLNHRAVFFATPTVWAGIYQKRWLDRQQIRFHETPGASYQDLSFSFKVWVSASRVYILKDAFLHYRRDNLDSSVNSPSKIFCVCDEFGEIERFMEQHPAKRELASLIFAKKFKHYRWNYQRLASAFQYAFLLRMHEELRKAAEEGAADAQFLTEEEYREAWEIIRQPDLYFSRTAKDYRDERLMAVSTLNLQFYKEGFLTLAKRYKGIIIYGAGVIGKRMAEKLMFDEKLDNIVCFAVTDLAGNPDKVLDLPVRPIEQLTPFKDDYLMLVAVRERDQYEILKLLKAKAFRHVASLDHNLIRALS